MSAQVGAAASESRAEGESQCQITSASGQTSASPSSQTQFTSETPTRRNASSAQSRAHVYKEVLRNSWMMRMSLVECGHTPFSCEVAAMNAPTELTASWKPITTLARDHRRLTPELDPVANEVF